MSEEEQTARERHHYSEGLENEHSACRLCHAIKSSTSPVIIFYGGLELGPMQKFAPNLERELLPPDLPARNHIGSREDWCRAPHAAVPGSSSIAGMPEFMPEFMYLNLSNVLQTYLDFTFISLVIRCQPPSLLSSRTVGPPRTLTFTFERGSFGRLKSSTNEGAKCQDVLRTSPTALRACSDAFPPLKGVVSTAVAMLEISQVDSGVLGLSFDFELSMSSIRRKTLMDLPAARWSSSSYYFGPRCDARIHVAKARFENFNKRLDDASREFTIHSRGHTSSGDVKGCPTKKIMSAAVEVVRAMQPEQIFLKRSCEYAP
ncbi:hypothetical protein B0H10DRAFT_1960237 [Mycena sp. CBHHK59/15]|nr:hypothetical protein B0H10DRAFT_1960237 [Mycena sp. CBHHK59/15]